MTKSDLSQALSLSCVENYYLAWIKNSFDERLLYCESYVPFEEVLGNFCYNDAEYASYERIPRVQETAEKLRVTKHKLTYDPFMNTDERSLVLARVRPSFFERYRTVPWREDHYICLLKERAEWISFLNQYPLSEGVLSREEIKTELDGTCLVFSPGPGLDESQLDILVQKQLEHISKCNTESVSFDIEELLKIRDALGVLKISRKRLGEWFCSLCARRRFTLHSELSKLLNAQILLYEQSYLAVELQIVRNKPNPKAIAERLRVLKNGELQLAVKISKGYENL